MLVKKVAALPIVSGMAALTSVLCGCACSGHRSAGPDRGRLRGSIIEEQEKVLKVIDAVLDYK